MNTHGDPADVPAAADTAREAVSLRRVDLEDLKYDLRALYEIEFSDGSLENRLYLVLSTEAGLPGRLLVRAGDTTPPEVEDVPHEAGHALVDLAYSLPLRKVGSSDTGPGREPPRRTVDLRTIWFFPEGPFGENRERPNQLRIKGELGGRGSFHHDVNWLILDAFGDVVSQTLIGTTPLDMKIERTPTADPAGSARELYELEFADRSSASRRFFLVRSPMASEPYRLVVRDARGVRHVISLEDAGFLLQLEQRRLLSGVSPREQRAVEAIREIVGDYFRYDIEGARVVSVSFPGNATEEALQRLEDLPHLRNVDLSRCRQLSRGGLAVLGDLAALEALSLRDVPLHDEDLGTLRGLSRLRHLDLYCEKSGEGDTLIRPLLTDRGLEHLRQFTKLESLRLSGGGITDGGLEHLRSLKRLKTLQVRSARTTLGGLLTLASALPDANIDMGDYEVWGGTLRVQKSQLSRDELEQLAAAENLKRLSLARVQLTREQLGGLSSLGSRLERLSLARCPVTDDDLPLLRSFTHLESLDLEATEVRGPGLAHLATLPRLKKLSLGYRRGAVGGGHLVHLGGLETLEHLDLSRTNISGGLQHLAPLDRLSTLDLSETLIVDEALRPLRDLPNLRDLNLFSCSRITPRAMAHLGHVPSLETLRLQGSQVNDEALAHIGKLPRLKRLYINGGPPITGAGLQHLKNAKTLQALSLWSCAKITDDDLVNLVELSGLRFLDLMHIGLSDRGMTHLAKLGRLEELNLAGNERITDAGIRHLCRLRHLEVLDLQGLRITDSGLESLSRVSGLRHLDLGNSRVTTGGLRRFRERLPNCEVVR